MKLPFLDQAVIVPEKITRYLLARGHEGGGPKAVFFEGCGFSIERWELFAEALKAHARTHDVAMTDATPFGTWYTVEGELDTPVGKRPLIRTDWFIDAGTSIPHLASAYPLRRRS